MATSPPRALQRCVGDVDRFAATAWGVRSVFHRSPGGFEDLLSLADVDHILSSMALRTPAFRLVKDGKAVPVASYTKSGRTGSTPVTGIADPIRIHRLFDEGATIVLQGMHRFWRPMSEFCRDLELSLGHPSQVNAYVTPPGSRGLAVHRDAHDVFVLQAFGRKHWEVWETGTRPVTESADDTDDERPAPAPTLSVELRSGDCLYIPKDTPHAARTQETVSGHITVGMQAWTWADVLKRVLEQVQREPELVERLPAGAHRRLEELAAAAEERLTSLIRSLEKVDPRDLAFEWVRRFLTSRPPLVEGTLEALLRVDEVDDATRLRRRRHSICELMPGDGRLMVFLGDRELHMPAGVEPAMRAIAMAEELRPADLAGHLDRQSRLVLVRRLVREGLLDVAPAE